MVASHLYDFAFGTADIPVSPVAKNNSSDGRSDSDVKTVWVLYCAYVATRIALSRVCSYIKQKQKCRRRQSVCQIFKCRALTKANFVTELLLPER